MQKINTADSAESLAEAVALVQQTTAPLSPSQKDALRRAYVARRAALGITAT